MTVPSTVRSGGTCPTRKAGKATVRVTPVRSRRQQPSIMSGLPRFHPSAGIFVEVDLIPVQIVERDAGAVRHRARLAVKRHAPSLHGLEVAMAVVRGERKQRFAPALLPDERLLIGRPRELEVDADSLALRRGHQQPAGIAQSLVFRHGEAEPVDVEPKGLILILHEQREYGEMHVISSCAHIVPRPAQTILNGSDMARMTLAEPL